MSQSQALQTTSEKDRNKIIERVISKGDLSELTPEQRVSYYNTLCQSLKLNPLTKPFDFLEIENKKTGETKMVLYANKDCAAQLKTNHQVSVWKTESKIEDGCLIVTAYARTPDGREDIDEGAVFVKGLVGESLCNARMKAVTKAKRRVTLSICGLGFLDESEIDSIPNAQPAAPPEDDAIMTEQEALTLQHKASGLDQWKCGPGLAMQILSLWASLKVEGAEEETLRSWLPTGIKSRKELDEEQARNAIEFLKNRLAIIKQCSLPEWKCSPDLAIRIMDIYGQLIAKGVDKETMQKRLPAGNTSFKTLTEAQAQEALKAFTHWLNTYNQAVQGEVINNA